MPQLTEDAVRQALARVPYPGFSRDIVSFGMVRSVAVEGDRVRIGLLLTSADPGVAEQLREAVVGAVSRLPGAGEVDVQVQRQGPARLPAAGDAPPVTVQAPAGPRASNIIGVASGKGGVGKSTVAVNLAVALARKGRRVGYLDADVHGPSAPLMFGLEGQKPYAGEDGRPSPVEAHGVRIMSMGFFVDRENAVIWRGPIVGNFIRQLLLEVDWGELDDLIIDFPPGTGDAQLTISQTIRMTGALVVSTPNDLALIDALKAIAMFRKVEVPVLGLVENMAWFECPHCHERTDIFGRGLVDRAAAEQAVPVLGRIPIDPQVVAESDAGVPVVSARPESAAGRAYTAIAEAALAAASGVGSARPARGLGAFFERFGKG
ncbi:MAG: Mrp/NBP35 family ATP-binding protein [Acidobacteria bacterium]|nr:Mrp/NBP35 family ATP-binding protein [Acidobacteriota bacterium]